MVTPLAVAQAIMAVQDLRPRTLTPISEGGSVNHVFLADGSAGRFILRFPVDPLRDDEFEVEAWCLEQAANHGIPSPQVVARGELSHVPYLVQTFVPGARGTTLRSRDAWRILAHYARIVHAIPVSTDAPDGLFTRFGRDPEMAWRAHLAYNLDQLGELDPLVGMGVYRVEQAPHLRTVLGRLQDTKFAFGLGHGDLSPRNMLIPFCGPPVLIDWGSASVRPVPFGDLLTIVKSHRLVGDPPLSQLRAFADELGTPLRENEQLLEDLLLLDALDLVRWAIDKRPDRLPELAATARTSVGQLGDAS